MSSKAEELSQWLEEAAGDYSQFEKRLGHEAAALLRKQDELLRQALEAFDNPTGMAELCQVMDKIREVTK